MPANAQADAQTAQDAAHSQPAVFEIGHAGLQLRISDHGATWLSCRVRLADGSWREVLLGHETPQQHGQEPGYLGIVVGRWTNRVSGAAFELDGVRHVLAANEGPNQLHGGPGGFHARRWQVLEQGPAHLKLGLVSGDGDQGWPGRVQARVEYRVLAPCSVQIRFGAETDRACPVGLTSHAYFNLDGDGNDDGGGRGTIDGQQLRVAADRYLPVDAALLPTGEQAEVAGTRFDFRAVRSLAGQALDHCFLLQPQARVAAELQSGDGRLALQLHTDYPALQVYTGDYLAGTPDRSGRFYTPRAGIALEPQFLVDAPNRPDWLAQGGGLLRPGEQLRRSMQIDFITAR